MVISIPNLPKWLYSELSKKTIKYGGSVVKTNMKHWVNIWKE